MMMNPNILNKNPLMFFDRAVNAQRSQLLTVMADAVSECRTAADQAAELNETGQVGLLRLAEVWSTIRAKEGMGGLVLEGTEAKILSDVVAQFYAYLSGCMFNDPVGMAIYAELYNQAEPMAEVYTHDPRLMEKLELLAKKHPDQITRKDAHNFTVPKRCVSVREPYSAERRKAASERAKAAGYQPPVKKSGS